MNKRAQGNQAEDRACDFLAKQGYRIIRRNWQLKFGEIDILAADPTDNICIIEVKSHETNSFGLAKEMVDYKKRQKLSRLYDLIARLYPQKRVLVHVIAIDKDKLEFYENALGE